MNCSPQLSVARWLIGASSIVVACSLQMPRESEIFSPVGAEAGAPVGAGGALVGGDAQAGGAAGAGGGRGGASGGQADSGSSTGGTAGGAGTSDSGAGGTGTGGAGTGTGGGAGGDDTGSGGMDDGGSTEGGGTSFNPEDGLVGHYTFDETSGVIAANRKDATKNGTYFGSCGHPNGRFGKAVSMRNSTTMDWVELPAGLLGDLSATTMIIWVRDLSVDRKGGRAFDFGSGSTDNFYFVPDQINPATSLADAQLGGTHTALGFVDLWTMSTVSLTDKVWHQIAISWTAQSIDLYVDAVAMGSKPSPGAIPSDLGATMPNWLGRSFNDVYPALYAEIDDLRIYDRALSLPEISVLYGLP
jgi:Concanavalin A-like lectin/glucanases superfamily